MGSKNKFIRTGVFPVAICIMSTDLALRAFSASSDEPARGRRDSVLFGICLYLSESCTSGRLFFQGSVLVRRHRFTRLQVLVTRLTSLRV